MLIGFYISSDKKCLENAHNRQRYYSMPQRQQQQQKYVINFFNAVKIIIILLTVHQQLLDNDQLDFFCLRYIVPLQIFYLQKYYQYVV